MDGAEIVAGAEARNIRLTRFLYCDNAGLIRGKATATASLAERIESGIGLTVAMLAMTNLDQLQPVEGCGPVGEIRLTPDPNTYVELPYAPRSAAMLCDMLTLDGEPWAVCPRAFLKRAIARAAERGLTFQAALEPEWTLGRVEAGRYVPADRSVCFAGTGFTTAESVIIDIVDALAAQGMRVEQYYPEAGSAQQELSIHHADALRAADNHMYYRETVRNVCADHGYVASFAAKPFPDDLGNGCHIHVSALDPDGRNAFHSPADRFNLSRLAYGFIAGVLDHLPALVALTCPSVNSYRRLQPASWSSAFTTWGLDNREAAVRIASPLKHDRAGSVNVELKAADSTSNPYLALGGLILAGLDGIERDLTPAEGQLATVDPGTIPPGEAERRGIRRLPGSLDTALDHLERDRVLLDGLGEPLARAYLAVRRAEARYFATVDDETMFNVHFARY